MRKILANPIIISTLLLILTASCYANSPGTTAGSFLKIAVRARASAMGEAFTAVASDGTCLYWNPAGLTQLKTKQISATYNSWFEKIRQGYLSLTFPSSRGTMGLGANYVDMGKLEGRDLEGNPTGDFTALR